VARQRYPSSVAGDALTEGSRGETRDWKHIIAVTPKREPLYSRP
jgi:hypothetical protein